MTAPAPVVAWVTSIAGVDGFGLVAAVDAAAAEEACRAAWQESNEDPAAEFSAEVYRLAPLDAWAAATARGLVWDLQVALFQATDAEKREASGQFVAALRALRDSGHGLTPHQAGELSGKLVLPWYQDVKAAPEEGTP